MKARLLRLLAVLVLTFSSLPSLTAASPLAHATEDAAQPSAQIDRAALAKIEPLLLKELEENGATTYLVHLHEKANLTLALAQAQPDKLSQRRAVVSALQATAARSQASVLAN